MLTLEEVLRRHPLPFTLTSLQYEDTEKAAFWGRFLGDLPVGSGKTVIATCAALCREPDVIIVLVPPILIAQWGAWLRGLPDIGPVLEYEGSPAHRKEFRIKEKRWLIMSFQIFKNDIHRFAVELRNRVVLTIVDEAHNLKSSKSVLYKEVRDFSLGRDLFLMTGTPLSSPEDAYAYIKLNTPEVYRSLSQFLNIHVAKRHPVFNSILEWQKLDVMQSNLALRTIRRTKEEVHATLPKAKYIPVYYDLSAEHMKLYKKLMEEQILEMNDGGKIDASSANLLYHHAQQIIANFAFYADDPSKKANIYELIDNVVESIELGQTGSSKLILWTQYKKTSASVLAYMNTMTKAVAAYSGADSQKSVKAFLEDMATTTLVAQPGSAGVGLNPQHLCWETFYIECPTSVIAFTQSAGRTDRIGQKHSSNIRLAVARGTIQEALVARLLKNDDLVNKVSGNIAGIKSLIFPSG